MKKQTQRNLKPLRLAVETIRQLGEVQLAQVPGGQKPPRSYDACDITVSC